MKQISLDALNNQMFETIEMLKNNSDPKASAQEKIDVDIARTIADLGKVVVDAYKVKAQILNLITKNGNQRDNDIKQIAIDSGINSPVETSK